MISADSTFFVNGKMANRGFFVLTRLRHPAAIKEACNSDASACGSEKNTYGNALANVFVLFLLICAMAFYFGGQ